MSDAAVGSISHILKTAFQDVYKENDKRQKAIEARAALGTQDNIQQELDENGEPIPITIDENAIENYYTEVEKTNLNNDYKLQLDNKKQQIEYELSKKLEDAKELANYLYEEKAIAEELEVNEEDELKRQGVILGQHIPSLPTKLHVDRNMIDRYGDYSQNLVIANDLVKQNRENFLRRSGNLPISDFAETRKNERNAKKANEREDIPHYVLPNAATVTREERMNVRYSAAFKTRDYDKMKKLERDTLKPPQKKFPYKEVLPAEQRLENEAILKGINHKLNYLRNPRNKPDSVTRMLVKSKASFEEVTDEAADEPEDGKSHATGTKSIQSSQTKSSKGSKSTKKTYGPAPKIMNNPLFQTEPKIIAFSNYVPGKEYTTPVSFRNVSAVTRTLRILPPSTLFFSIAPLTYPTNSKAGMVAPGMSVTTEVTFYPNSLNDFNDSIQVETESGSYSVAIAAKNDAPDLTIPSLLDMGPCFVGDAMRVVIPCHNRGGKGRFILLRPEEQNTIVDDVDWRSNDSCIRFDEFTIYPTVFTLDRKETIEIFIEYLPLVVGHHEQEFFILCDNCQLRRFIIKAYSQSVDVSISEINNVFVDALDSQICKDLFFDSANIGIEVSQEIVVSNDCDLPIEYEWVWVEDQTTDLLKSGERQLQKRLKKEAELFSQSLELTDFQKSPKGKGNRPTGTLPLVPKNDNFERTMSPPLPPPSAGLRQIGTAMDKKLHKGDTMMMDTFLLSLNETESKENKNEAAVREFKISPARGILNSEGSQKFIISFNPSKMAFTSLRALLMVKGIPVMAIPPELSTLQVNALRPSDHGEYYRLRSWIERMGQSVNTSSKTSDKKSKEPTYQRMTNLIAILDLIVHHIQSDRLPNKIVDSNNSGMADDVNRLCRWFHEIIEHVRLWRKQELVIDEDGPKPIVDGNNFFVNMYDWNGDESSRTEVVVPLLISRFEKPVPVRNIDFDDTVEMMDEEEVVEEKALTFFSEEERSILVNEWIDTPLAVLLLGPFVSYYLDNLIQHEAVEFLQESARKNLPSVHTSISGVGKSQIIQVKPPLMKVPGNLSIGKSWTGEFFLVNTSTAMAEVEVLCDKVEVCSMISIFKDETLPSKIFIECEPPRVLLMPEAEVSMKVTITSFAMDNLKIIVPLKTTNKYANIDNLTIYCSISAPRIRYTTTEVDMGLIGVGNSENKTLMLSNEGDIPLRYSFSEVLDDEDARREADELADLHSAKDSYKIPNKTALIIVDPPFGVIEPETNIALTVTCKAGQIPQRVRGTLQCSLTDDSGTVALPQQDIAIRGEIQSPFTIMYPANIDFGKVYVGMPVMFKVYVENMCNLPTQYKLELPGGHSEKFTITFDNDRGPLGPKEKIEINGTFIAELPGSIDEVVANKVFGVPNPLGFGFQAVAKGIQLDFSVLDEGEVPPSPLAKPTDTQFPGPGDVPSPYPVEPLYFGNDVNLYERRCIRVVMRNLSAIPAPYTMTIKKFPVVLKSKDEKDLPQTAQPKKGDLIPHEDGLYKFNSAAGKAYVGFNVQREEDGKYLQSQLGGSYSVKPATGTLAPWGVQVITIRTYNDMPGCYDDELICELTERGRIKKSIIPCKMTIKGCPLTIESNSLGMSFVRKGDEKQLGMKLLQMGNALVNAAPLVREFRVKNNGSKPGKIKWRMRSIGAIVRGPIKVQLDPDENGKVKVNCNFWTDINRQIPFKIEPEEAFLAPFGRESFKVTLTRTSAAGVEQALMSGAVELDFDEDLAQQSIAESVVSTTTSANKAPGYNLSLLLDGHFDYPTVRLDKNTFIADSNPSLVDDQASIRMKTQAPRLFAKGTKSSDVCFRPVTLVNPLHSNLVFTLSTEGPFILKIPDDCVMPIPGGLDSVSKIPSASMLQAGTESMATFNTAGTGISSIGKTFNLLPHGSITFSVAFAPKREVRERLAKGQTTEAVQEHGKLILSYATGQSLHVPLHATIATPFIAASAPRLFFGTCLVGFSTEGTLLLSNPTNVTGHWSVTHYEGVDAGRKVSSIKVEGFKEKRKEVDDPSVWEITPNVGALKGPTVSVAAAVAAPPKDFNRSENYVVKQNLMESSWTKNTLTLGDSLRQRYDNDSAATADANYPAPLIIKFTPKKNVVYTSRFRFTTEFGNTFDILLEANGTYEEHEHRPHDPKPNHEWY